MNSRLVTDHSLAAAAIRVPCLYCGKMLLLAEAIVDLNGPAFRAYYHSDHAPLGDVASCNVDGCKRPHVARIESRAL